MVAQGSDGPGSDTVDERSSRLLATASGVAAAVGVASLGLAYVATQAGFAGKELVAIPPGEPSVTTPASLQVRQVVSPPDVVAGDAVVRVKVETPVPEPVAVPVSVPAPEPPPPPAPESAPGATAKQAPEAPSSQDPQTRTTGVKDQESSPPAPERASTRSSQPSPQSDHSDGAAGGDRDPRWWDGSDAFWDWGSTWEWDATWDWDTGWGEPQAPDFSRLTQEQQAGSSNKNSDSKKSHSGSHKHEDHKHGKHR